MSTYTKYISTVGLNVNFDKLDKRMLAKVFFGKKEDGSLDAWVESAHTGGIMQKLGKLNLTQQQFDQLRVDAYDDIVFAEAAFNLFDGTCH